MHQYLESVRNEIEIGAGSESYLASTLFLRIFKNFQYEDDGAEKITNKDGYEKVQNKVINIIGQQHEFDIEDEILAWQAGILRDIAKDFYGWWVDYKDEKFRATDCFSDGESCLAIEATCEKLGESPTDMYTAILEVEMLLTRLCTSCNKTIVEIDKFWQFKFNNKHKANENAFMEKRIMLESKNTLLYKSIQQLKEVSEICRDSAKKLAGSNYLLWATPQLMLDSLINSLNAFLNFEYIEDADLELNSWLNQIFPKRLPDHQPNPIFQSGLHHQVIERLSQATQCLVQHTVRKIDAFGKRDEILRPFIMEALENVKIIELQNLNAGTSEEIQENSSN